MTSIPVPDRLIKAGEFNALLATVMLPVTLPIAAGANVTFSVTGFPGVMICPLETPLAAKPAPEIVTLETVILKVPEFVRLTLRALLLPTFTLLKFSLVVLRVSAPEGAMVAVALVESLFALVTPEHPDRIATENKSVIDMNSIKTRGLAGTCERVKK